ncbi:MAG: hypothetical protein FD164_1631 [Nitrospirae bacterium]|nr:MAG: hypothetical protein FD164_1631 [Nitrospirota bacterium]
MRGEEASVPAEREIMTDLGKWTETELDALLQTAQKLSGAGSRIGFLAKQFMGMPYKAGTLAGSATTAEHLVVNLTGVDCFTFLDYIEAMRRSASYAGFVENLKVVRYRNGAIDFRSRNHFFSDWPAYQPDFIEDITGKIAGDAAITVRKMLNVKAEGSQWIPGIEERSRRVIYLPSERVDEKRLAGLRTGDYIGIYSDRAGLDVIHVGVIVKGPFVSYLRHASSAPDKRRVVDDELLSYLSDKAGVIAYRAK